MHKLTPFPADDWQMVRFARYVANTVHTVGTVQNYTGGVKKLHDLGGYATPSPNESNFKLIIQALKAKLAKPVKQAKAMTPQLLRAIYDQVNLQDVTEVVCYTAILIGFYLFLRKSNLVPDSTLTFNPNEPHGRVASSIINKMEQDNSVQRKGTDASTKTCKMPGNMPYLLAQVHDSSGTRGPLDPLFSIPKKGQNVSLIYDQLKRLLSKWVEKTGTDPDGYTPHCLCRGYHTHTAHRTGG